LHIKHTETVI